jgi:hypothetical protein
VQCAIGCCNWTGTKQVKELPCLFFFTLERKLPSFHGGKKKKRDKTVLASNTQAKGSEVNSQESDGRVSYTYVYQL